MGSYFIIVLIVGTLSQVDSYRADFIPTIPLTGAVRQQPAHMIQQQKQGCVWSIVGNSTLYPPFLQQRSRTNSLALDCHVRSLNTDFWSTYTFTPEQLESATRLNVKCSEKMSSLFSANQPLFQLRNLREVQIYSCKTRKLPKGAFSTWSQLRELDISGNNIWEIESVFCPLRSLVKLNISSNNLSDLDELGLGVSSTSFRQSSSSSSNEDGGTTLSSGPCVLNIQNVDLSHNTLRRLDSNTFNRLRKLSELRLQNNLIELLDDTAFQGLNQLRLLNLSSNRLVAVPPSIFNSNPALREINLSNNSISALSPQVLSGLTTLLSLDLSRNTLTSQWVRENMFHGLIRLIILKLSHNQLSYIDQNIFKDLVNLQALHLDNNRIETVNPLAFQYLKNLHSLDLSYNRIALIDSRHFSNLFVLRQLYLDHNKIREIDQDSLKNCTHLQDLGIADNQLSQVPVALRGLNLVTLDIGENRIDTITNESFSGLGQLYGLRIVDNKISELSWGFCEPLTKLRVLNVAQNRISKISSGAFTACPELRALRLDTNALEELPLTLTNQLPSLLWLNVSENRLKWIDHKLLPPTIEWLDASYNMLETLGGLMSDDGGKDNVLYSLRVLDASHNRLTTLDYTSIPPTLETLRLNYNRLSSVAPGMFTRSSRLRRVELIGNQLEKLPLAALRFPPVQSGKPLPEFYIGHNPFVCDCTMEWLTRVNQLSVLRQHPRIVDLEKISCRPTFPRSSSSSGSNADNNTTLSSQVISITDARPHDFLCPYTSHCFTNCHCCEFDACDCEMTCPPGNCTCMHDSSWSNNIVECSNANFSQIPSRIPMDVTELYLDGNEFPILESHIFIGRKNLRQLYLNGSHIETISNKSFNGLKSLEILRLEDNLLQEIHGYEFADVENLRELYLQNNRLRLIAKDAFARIPFLQVLRIDGNFLFDFNVWELSHNGYLNSVTLANNPWFCDCEFLIPFRTWVASVKNTVVVDYKLATCQQQDSNNSDGSNNDKINVQLIINMCDHNKELNFNFNPNNDNPSMMNSELLNNYISAEKVASPSSSSDMNIIEHINSGNSNNLNNNYNDAHNDISSMEEPIEKGDALWTIFISVSITLIVLLLIISLVFRKKYCHFIFPFWLYSWLPCEGKDVEECNPRSHRPTCCSFLTSIFHCCCSGHRVDNKQSGSAEGTEDKLFDLYFLYSRLDEDLVAQKMASALEGPQPSSNGNGYRLCLHYRDLIISFEDNPLNIDMLLSACDASKRVVVILSRAFVQNELSHAGFRAAIQNQKNKLIFVLLPPFTEQNFATIYPELATKGSNQITSLEWNDKKFWSKLKLILPTATAVHSSSSPSGLNSTNTISSTGSSAIFNMAPAYHPHLNYNTVSLHEYAYNTMNNSHNYHRNILPFNVNNTATVPKHHLAMTSPAWQQQTSTNQNFYNSQQNQIITHIPGYPAMTGSAGATTPLMMQNSFHQPNFNESFRRHLQLQQSQNKIAVQQQGNSGSGSQSHTGHHLHHNHHHHHQGSHCSSSHSSENNPSSIHSYQPLANYSSSSSNEELLDDHVYSTLDSPPILNGCVSNSELVNKQINNNSSGEQDTENCSSLPLQNRLSINNNNNNNSNCPVANDNTSGTQSTPSNNGTNGAMYFV